MDTLEELLRKSTVRVLGPRPGAGFFIAPGVVISCAHVVGSETSVTIDWDAGDIRGYPATVRLRLNTQGHPIPALDEGYPDIAVLTAEGLHDHPCVALDMDWPGQDDRFQIYGYPLEGGSVSLTPALLTYRGIKGPPTAPFLDLAYDKVKPGMSGAAILNLTTGAVCGIVVASKDVGYAAGALGITWVAAPAGLTGYFEASEQFHRIDERWKNAVKWSAATRRSRFDEVLDRHTRDCIAHCPRTDRGEPIVTGRADDRERIATLVSTGNRFCWVRAPMSAGKTAVAAWLALSPPADAETVACFVGPTTDGDQFLDTLIRRLAARLRRSVDSSVTVTDKPFLFAELLEDAERYLSGSGRRLILVVDGLDEDPQPAGVTPIAKLLPRQLPDHVSLVLFSRTNPGPLPVDHPLRKSACWYELAPAEEARVEMERAKQDLDKVAERAKSLPAKILTALGVAGPLAYDDLVDLLVPDVAREVGIAIDGPLRRLVRAVGDGASATYDFDHIVLRQSWTDSLGPRATEEALTRLDRWVGEYADHGWPATTPRYCLGGYVDLLMLRQEATRLAELALDERWRARLLASTGSRVAEATAIARAQRALTTIDTPRIDTATRLAVDSFSVRIHLEERARPEMVAFDVRRGMVERAVGTVAALAPESDHWRSANVELIAALFLARHDNLADRTLASLPIAYSDVDLLSSVAVKVAAGRPDLAMRLADGNGQTLAAMAHELAIHPDYVDAALHAVRGRPAEQLKVARVLSRHNPRRALDALKGFRGYQESTLGTKLWRDASFARVETARSMTSADLAHHVLSAELEGTDAEAALVAQSILLAKQDRVPELLELISDDMSPGAILARFVACTDTAACVDHAVTEWWGWSSEVLDLLQRFDVVLASSPAHIRADFGQLLRSVSEEEDSPPRRPGEGVAVAAQLHIIDDFRDADQQLLARAFGTGTHLLYEARELAARRLASTEPRRAATLALESGPTATWVLRDVLCEIAATDMSLAIVLTDLVDPTLTGTRSVVLGALGAHVDPGDRDTVAQLDRRVESPGTSAAVSAAVADAALNIAVLLGEGNEKAKSLIMRFPDTSDDRTRRAFAIENAIRLASVGDIDGAMRGMPRHKEALVESDLALGCQILINYLPTELASQVIVERIVPSTSPAMRDRLVRALALRHPAAALLAVVQRPLHAESFAGIVVAANQAFTDDQEARVRFATEFEILATDAQSEQRLLQAWSATREGSRLGIPSLDAARTHDPILVALGGEDPLLIIESCELRQLEVGVALAAWVYDQPSRLPAAIAATFEHARDALFERVDRRVRAIVDAASAADPLAAEAVIDRAVWPTHHFYHASVLLLRDKCYETIVEELAKQHRTVAYRCALRIEDPWVVSRALAALATEIASNGASENGPALAEVLAEAHARNPRDLEFAHALTDFLDQVEAVDRASFMSLLAEASSWPASNSTYLIGPLFRLLRSDPDALSAAADALLNS